MPWQLLQAGALRSPAAACAVHAPPYCFCLVRMAAAAVDGGELLGVRDFLDVEVGVAGRAVEHRVRRGPQRRGVEGGRHAGLALAGAAAGVVAGGAVVGARQGSSAAAGDTQIGPRVNCQEERDPGAAKSLSPADTNRVCNSLIYHGPAASLSRPWHNGTVWRFSQ